MEAGPRDTAQSAEHVTTAGDGPDPAEVCPAGDRLGGDRLGGDRLGGEQPAEARPTEGRPVEDPLAEVRLTDDGPDETPDGVTDDGPEPEEMYQSGPEVEVELRPQRRLRIWQLAPIVALSAVGSLMFAFPLAFDFGDSGAVIAMLGLLICSCAAGWGMMAARRVGYTWPGLPARGSGRRPDWRVVLGYVLLVAVIAVLAVWRVARLR
ncbi:hypothetical protein BFF78_12170 [Streptomyces fodineus]|uniref:Transmembrane protein n=1 Tax=Streptomyces fodineus TaxID=1904616 RepID=A0A1D7Y7W9_9ACTN|nr:hypothetical protein [Streptomyces fodineus]AOR31705.1 hypothetical protein BFF78_12170 [Streptomyces fodineus]